MTDTPHIPPEVEAKLDEMFLNCLHDTEIPFDERFRDLKQQIKALFTEHSAERERQIKLIQEKVRKLEAGVIAIDFYISKPYPDDPRWTPYSRYIHPKMYSLRKAAFLGSKPRC